MFYDAIDRTGGDVRLLMATPLLAGLRERLGFLPDLVGAGLQGDYSCTPIRQLDGKGLAEHHVVALKFGGDIRIDTVILHGCKPATGYYTVTRAENQTVLEIDGQPALPFVQNLLGPSITPEEYAFFLIFGINTGDMWGEFDEKTYANRLCLAVDKKRNGIVMFEPDMVGGTRFQIMHRSLDLDYMTPKIETAFAALDGRKPVFALFIDCAGRAAGYAGAELEDAVVVQNAVAGRAPLLGIYSGVEIASVMGEPRALDWTGVFCLFSVSA
jgi:small ligand-binding sensory domain FIST